MKHFRYALISLWLAPGILFAGKSYKEIFSEAEKYTVRVYSRTTVALETSYRESSEGSGFIFHIDRKAGIAYVATNKHIIGDGVSSVQVSFKEGERFSATPIYIDPIYDFGIITFRLDAVGVPKDVRQAVLGNSKDIDVGHPVGAFGNPQGYEYSATQGIVSSTTNNPGDYGAFIQTDAALNPGNSGGPLISLRDGKVIGVCTIKDYGEGLSWALAIDQLKPIMDQVIKGEVPYTGHMGWIGASVQEITVDRAKESFGANYPGPLPRKALMIVDVMRKTPADEVGFRSGDIIISVNGKTPKDESEYLSMLRDLADKPSAFKICREGKDTVIYVTPIDRGAYYPTEYIEFGGMTVQRSTPKTYASKYSWATPECVFIADVKEGSSAETWGVPRKYPIRGVLVRKKYYPVESLDDFWEAIKDVKPEEPVELFLGLQNYGWVVKLVYYDEEEAPVRKKVKE
ncbi:MAG: trypsin-like peptidase domain-containing protein [candidate division WOR-3 bacterium]